MNDKNALLIIDVQNDFCPGGSLAVKEGNQVIPVINKISRNFPMVIATQDWHPLQHSSFASTHQKHPYEIIESKGMQQVLWPDHCVQGSTGAQLHPELDLNPVKMILRKGFHPDIDSYSAFLENDHKTETGLHYYLKGMKIKNVYLTGLATDYCVFFSAMDAIKFGFKVFLIFDACKGVDLPENNIQKTIETMKKNGVKIIGHEQI